jgi:hypothetical protein
MDSDCRGRVATLIACLLVIGSLHCGSALALEVSGVTLDEKAKVTADGPPLVLNGAGLRMKVIFKIYVAALYLTEKKTSTAEVLALKGPKRVQLTVFRDLSAEQLTEALSEGLRNNNSAEELVRLKPQIDALLAAMLAIKQASTGNVIAFDYIPAVGTRISLNGEAKSQPIAGEELYNAVLKIWIGDKPVEDSLKKGMLGG